MICDGLLQPRFCCKSRTANAFWLRTQTSPPQTTEPKGDGQFLANVPEQGKNPFGRPIFQNLQYSDTPTQPLVQMQFTDTKAEAGKTHRYRVIAVNTVGLKSR